MVATQEKLTRHCAACGSFAACRYAFGRYFTDKSRGGIGCRVPFDPPPEYLASIQKHLTQSQTLPQAQAQPATAKDILKRRFSI